MSDIESSGWLSCGFENCCEERDFVMRTQPNQDSWFWSPPHHVFHVWRVYISLSRILHYAITKGMRYIFFNSLAHSFELGSRTCNLGSHRLVSCHLDKRIRTMMDYGKKNPSFPSSSPPVCSGQRVPPSSLPFLFFSRNGKNAHNVGAKYA